MSAPSLRSVIKLVTALGCCCLSVVLCSVSIYGQAVTGSLVGTVRDVSGAVITGAEVVITETQTQVTRSVQTNESGTFTAPNLPAGTYSLAAEVPGFRRTIRENVGLLVNTTVRVDLELQPGLVTETVNVTAEVPALQTDRADTGRKIETRQITDMPLPFNRNFQGLLNLVPGVNRVVRVHSEFYNPQDALSARVNGQARQGNNVQIEGVDNNFRNNRLTVMIPPIEALAAVDITTSNYEAELGKITFRDLIFGEEYGQGLVDLERSVKGILPAGASANILTEDALDTPLDYEAVAAAGSMLGSASIIIMDDTVDIVWAAQKMTKFFKHESCGKCTPCREGTHWMLQMYEKFNAGQAQKGDIELLGNVAGQIVGKCFCLLGEFATSPVLSSMKHWKKEYEAKIKAPEKPAAKPAPKKPAPKPVEEEEAEAVEAA